MESLPPLAPAGNRNMRHARLPLLVILALVAKAPSAAGQAAAPPAGPIAVYIDCRSGCDQDFLRTEITYVNWVRDREVADVHVLVTSQDAGAGGEQFTLAFIGLRGLAGRGDTLAFTTNPTTTNDERRKMLAQTLGLGLVQFAARTPAGRTLRVTSSAGGAKDAGQETAAKNDPWNAWVFELSVRGSMNGERAYQGRDINMQLEANRVTERWKTHFNYEFSYNDNKTTVEPDTSDDGTITPETTYSNIQRDWQAEWGQVKSISDHFSLGTHVEVAQQTFRNQALRWQLRGAFEYNLFPYAEATRRELSLRCGVGVTSFRYRGTTIFNKISEILPSHFVELSYRTRQPWGSANVNLEHRNFLTDAAKRSTEINGNFNVRLFKGLSLNAGCGYVLSAPWSPHLLH